MISFTKHILTLVLFSLMVFSLIGQNFPEAISVRKITVKENASGIDFHNDIIKLNQALQDYGKGVSVMLWWGDRGERKNQMIHTWAFDLKANRDYYFPGADAEDYPKLGALIQQTGITVNPMDERVEGLDTYTDYVVVGFHELDNPMGGDILALREFEVKDGMEGEFESFLTSTFHPMYQKNVEGMTAYVLKGDRGERAGKYVMAYSFDTYARRDLYFPTEGEGGSEAMDQAAADMPDLTSKMMEFIVEDSANAYTDYLRIY